MSENRDTEERRTEFIEAAEKLFKKNGIVDTTISAIVKEMDVAKGLFYYYFKSKDDVIDAICDKYNREFRRTIQRSLNDGSFDERLDQFIENSIISFRNMWNNLHGEVDNIDLSILSSRSLEDAKETAADALRQLLEEGNRMNRINIRKPKYYADIIIGGIADLVSRNETDIEEIKEIIKDLIIRSGREKDNG